jgi:hypothetical protein
MTGYFWKTHDANAFGAYRPSLGTGLYHIADEATSPGMKLWSYGVGDDRAWATLRTASSQLYIEIQGGPIADQSVKLELPPQKTHTRIEYWIPTDRSLNIYSLRVCQNHLRPVNDIPLFEWARSDDVRLWNELISAYEKKGTCPIHRRSSTTGGRRRAWKIWGLLSSGLYGIPTAPKPIYGGSTMELGSPERGKIEDAIHVFADCQVGVAKALLARIYRTRGEMKLAATALEGIREPWLQLHPQVVVERGRALRALGTQTLPERERWLDKVASLKDEWIIERRVQLLIDKGEIESAKQLLLLTPFQKVHQCTKPTPAPGCGCRYVKHRAIPVIPFPHALAKIAWPGLVPAASSSELSDGE